MELLLQLMRLGKISRPIVRYCAALGGEACSMIFPNEDKMTTEKVLGNFDKKFCVEFAVWCTEKALSIFEEEYPEDDRPRLAIEAAKRWLEDPSEENRLAVEAAAYSAYGDAVYAVAEAADTAATYAAYAARAASTAAWACADFRTLDYEVKWAVEDAASALGDHSEKLLIDYLMKDI